MYKFFTGISIKKVLLPLIFLRATLCFSQTTQKDNIPPKPKLVIGIVIDQMRYDYLYRYQDKFGEGGFKRLLNQGYLFRDTHYNYIPTYTGPGHAAVYSGTTPSYNGIIANDWYDRVSGHSVYVTEDTTEKGVGGTGKEGQMSPRHLLSTTVTDELRLATNRRSKVIGISLKDRGAILPAGHLPNAAYWYDADNGNWITSTFYMKDLPNWVKSFNKKSWPICTCRNPGKRWLHWILTRVGCQMGLPSAMPIKKKRITAFRMTCRALKLQTDTNY